MLPPQIKNILLALCCLTTGCASYISGDLKDIETKTAPTLKQCNSSEENYTYRLDISSDARNDYSDQNISGYLSIFSLGIIPTYWTTSIETKIVVRDEHGADQRHRNRSRVHKFYGWLWLFILPHSERNSLPGNESAGISVEDGVVSRSMAKLMQENQHLNAENTCIAEINTPFHDYAYP